MTSINIQKVSNPEDRSLPIFADFDRLADRIRERAFDLFNGRGCRHGHAMDDWLSAEREICWPAAELTESETEYELDVALAGFEPDDIDITATASELIVKATHESKNKKEKKREDAKIRWSEFRSEDVYRHVELPETVDVDHISAQFEGGLLRITAPKVKDSKAASKRIKISTAA